MIKEQIVGLDYVFPPIVRDTVRAACHFGQMREPPLVMRTTVGIGTWRRIPGQAVDLLEHTLQLWKVEPIVAATRHQARVAPIVILLAVRRKVHRANLRLPRILFVVTRIAFE